MTTQLFLALVVAVSQGPQRSGTPQPQPQPNSTQPREFRPAPAFPPASPPTGQRSTAPAQRDNDNSKSEGWADPMTWLTLGLLLIAGVQVQLFRRQLAIMDGSLADAKAAAVAAQASADLAKAQLAANRDTTQRQLRAYVAVATSGLKPDEWGDTGRLFVVVRNSGQTPAYGLRSAHGLALIPIRAINSFAFSLDPLDHNDDRGIMVGAGCDYTVRRSYTKAQADAVKAGTHQLFIYGHIEYTDTFGEQHYTNFRLHWGSNRTDVITLLRGNGTGNDGN